MLLSIAPAACLDIVMDTRAFLTSSGCGHTSRLSWQGQQLLPWLTAAAVLTSLQWPLCAFPSRICTLLSLVE
jgi:hypothetical protein